MEIDVAIIRAVNEFATTEYPQCEGIVLFGSHAEGSAHCQSDVDLYAILPTMQSCYQELRHYLGYVFDLHVYDLRTLCGVIRQQRHARVSQLAASFAAGRVLLDRSGKVTHAHRWAAELLSEPLPPMDWGSYRVSTSALLGHLRKSTDAAQRISCLTALYRLLTNIMLIKADRWLVGPTQLASALDVISPCLGNRATRAYQEAIGGNAQPFVAFVEEVLDDIGGPLRVNERRVFTAIHDVRRQTQAPYGI